MQKVIVIPDSFKGSMTSQEVTDILAGSIEEHLKCEVVRLPIADGGEGSMDCILRAKGGSRKTVTVHSPEGKLIEAAYGILPDGTAVLEIAESSGLTKQTGFRALEASTFNMTSIWFAIGSAAALLCCVFTGSFRVQAVVFIAVSAVCLLAFKPLAKRLHKQPTPTNGDRALGREARVLTPVSAQQTGRVRLDGVDWNARCATPGDTLGPGALCRVTEIHSTLLIVEPVLTESRNRHTTT